MKKILNIIAISSSLLLTSGCGDFLEVEPQNVITIDQFWNEQGDVESILGGCYNKLAAYNVISRMLIWGEFRSENVFVYGSTISKDLDLEHVLRENITASNSYTSWTAFYDVINCCNIVIKYAPTVAEKDPSYTQGMVDAHIAEAVALRSLCYFYLIRTFENVPYTEEAFTDDSQTLDLPATDFDTILGNMINSLEAVKEDAVTKYPVSESSADVYNTSRVTKYFIYALLCDMYLWKQDYDNCIKYADLIIEYKIKEAKDEDPTADYSLTYDYPLIPAKWSTYNSTYGNAFTKIFSQGNSQESILEIYFDKTSAPSTCASNAGVGDIYGSGTLHRVRPADPVKTDISSGTKQIFHNKYDGRYYENMRFDADGVESINKYRCYGSVMIDCSSSIDNASKATQTRGTIYSTGDNDVSYNKANFILYRLTDIMLLKAEALVQEMSDSDVPTDADKVLMDEAFELVDAVNRRSLYIESTSSDFADQTLQEADYASKNLMTGLVLDERNRELMFEGKHYFDLVRRSRRDGNTNYLCSRVKTKDSNVGVISASFMKNMKAIYWPYNLDEIKVNTNLHQNEAFGSGENGSYQNNIK